MRCVLFLAIGALSMVAPHERALAETSHSTSAEYDPCGSIIHQDDYLACAKAETDKQDMTLNAAYNRLYAIMKPHQRNLLQKNERAWIQFRDAECDFQGGQLIGGPPGIEAAGQVAMKADCLLKQTHLRVQTLDRDYTEARQGGAG